MRAYLATLIVAVVSLSACATLPAAEQEGARLMALMKTASGGAALDTPAGFYEAGTALRDGAPAAYETWGDLRTLKSASRQTFGGATLSSGFDGKTSWSIDPSGAVTVDASPEGVADARLGAYLTVGAYFYPDRFPARFEYAGDRSANGKTYNVVTVTPEGSPSVDLWLDTQTHLLQRISGMDRGTPFYGDVKRYETIDGAKIGFELHQTIGEHQLQLMLKTYRFEAVPAERFAPPAQ